MLRPFAVLASFSALVCLSGIAPAQTGGVDPTPAVSGYVTRISSPSDFDVNGLRVLFGPKTRTLLGSTDPYAPRITGGEAFFGERVDLYGRIDRKIHQIEATEIVFCKFKPEVLSGFAVIDRVLSSSTPGPLIVRADGYLIQIKPSARIDYVAPVTSLSDIRRTSGSAITALKAPMDSSSPTPSPFSQTISRTAKAISSRRPTMIRPKFRIIQNRIQFARH